MIPLQLRNRIFEKAFNAAEIARFQPEQVQAYETSLKYYRDLKNVIDTAFDQGVALVALNAIREGLPDELIARLTSLDLETIRAMRQTH